MAELHEITDEVATRARDVAYVAVGVGVLAFQRAQVERRQLQQRLGTDLPHVEGRLADVRSALPDLAGVRSAVADLADLRSAVATSLQRLDEVVEEATQLIESTLEPLEDQMPAAARELAHRALQQARGVGGQLRGLAGSAA